MNHYSPTKLQSMAVLYHYIYSDHLAIEITGDDTITFLQGQMTTDLTNLSQTNPVQLTAICNLKGRVIALGFCYYVSQSCIVFMVPKNHAEFVVATLKKYAIFSKVDFDISSRYQLCYNPECHLINAPSYLDHSVAPVEQLTNQHQSNITADKMMLLNMQHHLPTIDQMNYGQFLPAELNLDQYEVIDYKKGCFMGQEVVARMKYRGQQKKCLALLKMSKNLTQQGKLYNQSQKPIATVVNDLTSNHYYYALVVINQNYVLDHHTISLENDHSATVCRD